MGKSRTITTLAKSAGTGATVSVEYVPPAMRTSPTAAMETAASAPSSVSMPHTPNTVDGDVTRPPIPMQVSSSVEGFVVEGGNDGMGASELPSPLPRIWLGGVSSSRDENADGQSQKRIATPLISVNDTPAK